jgi:hypothetical protein
VLNAFVTDAGAGPAVLVVFDANADGVHSAVITDAGAGATVLVVFDANADGVLKALLADAGSGAVGAAGRSVLANPNSNADGVLEARNTGAGARAASCYSAVASGSSRAPTSSYACAESAVQEREGQRKGVLEVCSICSISSISVNVRSCSVRCRI